MSGIDLASILSYTRQLPHFASDPAEQVLWACVADAGADATAAAVAVAETGTVVLDGSAGQGRRVVSLLPGRHVCVVRPTRWRARCRRRLRG
jgi:L-lactate utilization protein LutC